MLNNLSGCARVPAYPGNYATLLQRSAISAGEDACVPGQCVRGLCGARDFAKGLNRWQATTISMVLQQGTYRLHPHLLNTERTKKGIVPMSDRGSYCPFAPPRTTHAAPARRNSTHHLCSRASCSLFPPRFLTMRGKSFQ